MHKSTVTAMGEGDCRPRPLPDLVAPGQCPVNRTRVADQLKFRPLSLLSRMGLAGVPPKVSA